MPCQSEQNRVDSGKDGGAGSNALRQGATAALVKPEFVKNIRDQCLI
jgi:hypothetical protein